MQAVITHSDMLLNYYSKKNYCFRKKNKCFHVDLPGIKTANVKIVTLAIFVKPDYSPEKNLEKTINIIKIAHKLIKENKDLRLIKNIEDFIKVNKSNNIGVILALEGAHTISNMSILKKYYQLGIRMISLTWNNSNHLADGVFEVNSSRGLSQIGKKILKKMEQYKIITDVSHLSQKSFWDVLNYTKKPLIASHSNVKSICDHPRNLNDEQINAVINSGGIIGINFYPTFLNNSSRAEIKDIIKHIDYIRALSGIHNISLGTDFDGIDSVPVGLENIAKLPVLSSVLKNYGYQENEIKGIYYENFFRFLRAVWS